MKIQNVKGGYDYLPKEQRIRDYIVNILKETFEEYGFFQVETPILCYYDMLCDKYDDQNDILKEIYKLTDQGDRSLGLRYDLTVPFAKLIALNKNKISFPFKRYEISKVFRDGPIKVGRDREFTQCDADVVGIEGQYIEAELISLFKSDYEKLGIDINIKFNNRKLMTGLILESGVSEDLVSSVTTIIDKIDKYSSVEIDNFLYEIGLSDSSVFKLNQYFKMDIVGLKNKFQFSKNDMIKEGLLEIESLISYLKGIGIYDICDFQITLARGQNYYTGNVFEVYDKSLRIKSSIGAGGRYDTIIGNFINDGCSYPAVGISFGLSAIYELLKDDEKFNVRSQIDIYIIPMDTQVECLKLSNDIRRLGYNVCIEMNGRKIKKCMEFANKEKIPYVIVYGDDEVKNGYFKLKDMFKGDEIIIKNFNEIKNYCK